MGKYGPGVSQSEFVITGQYGPIGNNNQILTGFCGQYGKILARGQKYGPSVSEVHAFDQGPIFSGIDQSNQLILGLLPRF